MRTNTKTTTIKTTFEGGLSSACLSPKQELRRTVMANMLFEDSFYESGADAAVRMRELLKKIPFEDAAEIAVDAREKMKLRHVPLLIVRELLRNHNGRKVGDLIERIIQRPDEMGELLSIYWADGKDQPLTSQLKIGLARAFGKFNEYQLAKWDKDAEIKLRDVLFLTHAKPVANDDTPFTKVERNAIAEARTGRFSVSRENTVTYKVRPQGFSEQEILYGKIAHDMLNTPDTWEVELSGIGSTPGISEADKAVAKRGLWVRLMTEHKLGAMALLRNLRNMLEVRVPEDTIRAALANMNAERVLPFRFISAAKYAPRLEDALEAAMFRCLKEVPKLEGRTALLVDHSGSMSGKVSSRSEISRFVAAAAMAMILRETSERCRVFTFSDKCIEIPNRRGFAMVAEMQRVRNPVGTYLGRAVKHIYSEFPECDRIIVVTDEQSADRPQQPQGRGYIINVAGYQNGIGYGPWVTIDGWSEAILDYIREFESPITEV